MIESSKNIKKKTKKHAGWRPSVVTPEVIAKLEYGFTKWLTDLEACLYADISKDALYNYINKNPEFSDRKELLKQQPKMKAKINIAEKIEEKDDYNSRWYLETKWKDEFSKQVKTINENTNTNADVTDDLTDEQKKKIAERFMR